MVDFTPSAQTVFSVMGIISFVAIAYIGFRSRLPNETIQVQNQSIKALQDAHNINNSQIQELRDKVTTLEAENNLLKTIPLASLADTNSKMLTLLITQNKILTSISVSSGKTSISSAETSLNTGETSANTST